jgi:chorismate synthase
MLLKKEGISVSAYVSQIGSIRMTGTPQFFNQEQVESSAVRCPEKKTSDAMISLLDDIKKEGDTLGGTITCLVKGTPPGLGEPVFDRFEADLAKAVMSINAVKGFDIGSGFAAASARGSEHNDPFRLADGKVTTSSNHSGGVQGGITNGQDIYFRAFFKPVATLMQDQVSVDRKGKEVMLKGKGRHDVCVVPRAVPIVEAMTAITVADFYLRNLAARI